MKRKAIAIFVCLFLIMTMTAGCGGADKPAESKEIKIGFLGALTGSVATYGIATLDGMKMAAEEINKAGGVLGKEIKIVEYDNRGDKAEGASVTRKMISQDKVAAVVGDPTTGITKVAAPICQENKVVLLSAGATGPDVVEIGDYIFRNTLLDVVGGPTTMKYIIQERGWKKIALITSKNNDFSVGLTEIFRKGISDNGGEIVIEESVQDGDTDFSAQVTNIKAKDPDVIVFSGYYTEGGLIMQEVRKQGMKRQVMVGGDGLQSPVWWELGKEAVEGSITYAGFSPEQPTEEQLGFINAYKAKSGKEPDMFVAQGYDAVMILAEAMEKAKSAEPAKYRDALAQTKDYPGVSGNTTFRDDREPLKSPIYLLEIKGQKFSLLAKVPVTQ